MKQILYSGLCIFFAVIAGSGIVQGQARNALPIPMNFELSGTVEALSPDFTQMNIGGQTMNIGEHITIHNLVDQSPVAPIKVGSLVGYETNQLPGGAVEIVVLWVLSSP